MIHIRTYLLLSLLSLVIAGCAASASKDTVNLEEHGFVVGRLGFTATNEDALALIRELHISVKKDKNIIFNAFSETIKNNNTDLSQSVFFSYPLKSGTYHFNQPILSTIGYQLTTEEKVSMSFDINTQQITYIGLLELVIDSEQGTFAIVINKQPTLTHNLDSQQQDMMLFTKHNAEFASLPIVTKQLLPQPTQVHLIAHSANSYQYKD